MLVYLILLTIVLILAYYEKESNSNKFSVFIFVLIWFIFSFRAYTVGSDTQNYINDYIYENEIARGVDLGYTYYCDLLRGLGVSPRVFLIISSFIIAYPVWLFIKRFSHEKMMSYFFYITIGIFSMNLTGVRQSIAVSIILFAYTITANIKKRFFKYVIIFGSVYLARMFHYSAYVGFLYIILVWLSERQFAISKKGLPWLLLIPIILVFFVSMFSNIVNYFMQARYESYELGNENINIVAFLIIPYTIFAFNTILAYNYGLASSHERFFLYCSLIYVVCAVASLYMPILSRLSYYYSLPTMVLIPSLVSQMKLDIRRSTLFVLVVVCITFFIVSSIGDLLRIDHYVFDFS